MKKIVPITLILLVSLSCSAQKIDKNNKESYKVLNSLIDSLHKDTIYIRKKTYNKYLKEFIKKKEIIPSLRDDIGLINIFSNESEVNFLLQQLEKPFTISLNKINSKKVYEYIDPFTRKNAKGEIILDHYFYKVTTSYCYSLSKPIFTFNNRFSFILVSADNLYIVIQVFKNEKNKWKHYKYINPY